jgi:hypothetical protein
VLITYTFSQTTEKMASYFRTGKRAHHGVVNSYFEILQRTESSVEVNYSLEEDHSMLRVSFTTETTDASHVPEIIWK